MHQTISHNAPVCNRNVHIRAHSCCKNGALWDICWLQNGISEIYEGHIAPCRIERSWYSMRKGFKYLPPITSCQCWKVTENASIFFHISWNKFTVTSVMGSFVLSWPYRSNRWCPEKVQVPSRQNQNQYIALSYPWLVQRDRNDPYKNTNGEVSHTIGGQLKATLTIKGHVKQLWTCMTTIYGCHNYYVVNKLIGSYISFVFSENIQILVWTQKHLRPYLLSLKKIIKWN